jgi:tetratricopeptide (TPR) repeat protein
LVTAKRATVPESEPRRSSVRRVLLFAALGVVAALAPWAQGRVRTSLEAGRHLERGAELLNRGDAAGAEQEWRAAAQIAPANPNAGRALGTLLQSQGRLDEAREVLLRLAEAAPREPHVLCELADAELRSGTMKLLEAAAADGERAAGLEPDCLRAQTVAGNAWTSRGDPVRGASFLRRAVQLNPADVPLALRLAEVLLDAQLRDDAARTALDLTRRYPGYAGGYLLLARCYRGYPPGSAEARGIGPALRTAVQLDPTDAEAQAQLARHLLGAGDAAAAVRHLEASRLLNPRRAGTLFDLGRVYQAVGRHAEAERMIQAFRRRTDLEAEADSLEKRLLFEPTNEALFRRLKVVTTALEDPARLARARHRMSGQPAPAPTGSP